jgi:hypothetical protein
MVVVDKVRPVVMDDRRVVMEVVGVVVGIMMMIVVVEEPIERVVWVIVNVIIE